MILNDVCELIVDTEHKTAPRSSEGYPSIRTPNIGKGRFLLEGVYKVSKETYNQWTRRAVPMEGDLILAREAPVGNVAVIPKGLTPCLGQRTVLLRPKRNKILSRYLCYYLLSNEMQNLISSLSSGATVAHLNMKDIRNLELGEIPNISFQKRIADILSAYDDLIENNLKRIKLLEQAVQNIYKEWFVNLRFPGHEHTPFDQETDLPKGWETNKLSEYIDFKEGPGLRNWQYRTEGVPFLNIRMMNSGDLDFSSVKYLEVEEVQKKYKHFLLEEFDHIISSSGTLGKVVTIRKPHLPICLNTSIIRLRPIEPRVGKWYIKRKVSSKEFVDEMKSFATGSAQLNFGPKHLNMMNIVVPNEELSKEYERLTNPIELKILTLLDFNQKLKAARDILLPRLMNRTIEV